MTAKERAITALHVRQPDKVPTFELEFQLEDVMFGRKFHTPDMEIKNFAKLNAKEKEKRLFKLAEDMVYVYEALEYSMIPGPYGPLFTDLFWRGSITDELKTVLRYVREMAGNEMMLAYHGDGTFGIPDGSHMYAFAYQMADDPKGLLESAEREAAKAIERNKVLNENGVECLLLCSDYCYNTGPFLSPEDFGVFIQPFLYKIIEAAKKDGQYTVKHTDGNIMPILDQLVECRPHALHSIDPMAGVDIKEVKKRVGDKVCLIGNVHCAALQTGTDEEVIASAEYCLTHAKPGGGYIFSTSNVPFKGMPPERYKMILDVWRRMRDYPL